MKGKDNLTKISRRDFLKGSAFVASSMVVLNSKGNEEKKEEVLYTGQIPDTTEDSSNVRNVYSTCLQCRSDCGIVAHVRDGILMKVDGNPYHPNTREEDEILDYSVDPEEAKTERGRLCPRGQAAPEVLYDPFRIKTPLKRVGPRGSGKWKTISWEQAITEIVEGGDLFGEGYVEGLRAIRNLNDDIDPAIPELGKKANQLLVMVGRMEEGQNEFNDRFFKSCFGTINYRFSHGSICEESWFVGAGESGAKNRKPDFVNCKYLLVFGCNYFEANFPMQSVARKIVNGFKENGGKLVVVNPRMSNSAAKADRWIPVKPGGDIGIILGMIRWIIENKRYNELFLKTCSAETSTFINGNDRFSNPIKTHSSASHLVITDPSHPHYKKFLTADEAGLPNGTSSEYVVVVNGVPRRNTEVTSYDEIYGIDLEFSGKVNGIDVKSSFLLLKEHVQKKSYSEYAEIAGIDEETIKDLAFEFTSYGTKAVADSYRAVAKKTGGSYNSFGVAILNVLVGNIDRVGGWVAGGGKYDYAKKSIDISKVPNGVTPKGIPFVRSVEYLPKNVKNMILRDGYPPKRPWYTHASWQEIIPSIKAKYPYPIKCLITYWADPAYTIPANKEIAESVLKDTNLLPLYIAVDININETTLFADYILPDGTYLERWGCPGSAPTILTKVTSFRQPVVGTYDKGTPNERDASEEFDLNAVNDYTPVYEGTKTYEDILIMIGKKLGLPGVGENAFEDGSSLNVAWDYWKKVLKNIVADANSKGFNITEMDVIKRGGVFEPPSEAYDFSKDFVKNRQNGKNNLYSEKFATHLNTRSVTRWDPTTGEPKDGVYFSGLPEVVDKPVDSMGNEIDDPLPITLITYKPPFHTQSRTIVCPSLQMHMPESFVEINSVDALERGIETGDMVKVYSVSNPNGIVGRALVTEAIRPKVIAISNSLGHWEMRSRSIEIDGVKQDFDSGRALGLHSNLIMRLDPVLNDVVLTDPIGVSASFYETKVEVIKI